VTTLLKYWPLLTVPVNLFVLWICWSMRQFTKNEVQAIVAGATKPIVEAAEGLASRVAAHHDTIMRHDGQIEEIRADIRDLPTKADLARVEGEIRTVADAVAAASAGISRLENYFLERGVRGDRT